MNKFNAYILTRLFGAFLLIIFAFTAVAWLTQSLRLIELIAETGGNIDLFIKLSLYIIPSLLWIVIPPSVFIVVIFTFHKFYENSELIVMKSSSLSNFQLFKPVLLFVFIICLLAYAIGAYFLPKSHRNFKDLQANLKANYASFLIKEGVFANPVNGITVLVEKQLTGNKLEDIFVYDNRDAEAAYAYFANQAVILSGAQRITLKLIDGNRQEFIKPKEGKREEFNITYFDEYIVNIDNFIQTRPIFRIRKAEERYIHELLNPKEIEQGRISDEKHDEFIAEALNRIFIPLPIFIFAMLALLPFFKEGFNRNGEGRHILRASILAIIALGFMLSSSAIMAKNLNIAYLNYGLLTGVILYLLFHLLIRQRLLR